MQIDHNITEITTNFWNLPPLVRRKILLITELIFNLRLEGVLNYNHNDEQAIYPITNSFLNMTSAFYGTPLAPEIPQDRYFISILYNNNVELFRYMLDNMNNTATLIEDLPAVFDYVTNAASRESLKNVLNSIYTINLIKAKMHDELYWYELRQVFLQYVNDKPSITQCFNISYIHQNMCGRITVNLVDDANHSLESLYFVPDYTTFSQITAADIDELYIAVNNAQAQDRNMFNAMYGRHM